MQISIFLIYFGLLLTSLSFDKHYKQMKNKTLIKPLKYTFFIFGMIFLVLALIFYIVNLGVSLGLTNWFAVLTPVIVLIGLLLTYKPKIIIPMSIAFLVVSILLKLL